MGVLDEKPPELEALLLRHAGSIAENVTGPFTVRSVSRRGTDTVRCEVTAYRLVPVDPADPALREVWIPLPVSGWVELRGDGSVAASSLPQPGPDELQEAGVFARDLIEQGSVRGLSTGPGARPGVRFTHEVQTDPGGRRVIRRIGYTVR